MSGGALTPSEMTYREDFERAWADLDRQPVIRTEIRHLASTPGGLPCCGTVSAYHHPWCVSGPHAHRGDHGGPVIR